MPARRSSFFLSALSALLFVLAGAGCDRYARHRVLTFFFTGVPPLDDGKSAGKGKEPGPKEGQARETARAQRRKAPVVRAVRFSHGPYASGACYLCHETSETGGFRGLGKKEEAKGAIAKAGVVPGKLVVPLRELCTRCHESKILRAAQAEGLWSHGPVAAGYCTLCHGPHSGAEQYLLPKRAEEVCAGCHADGFLFDTGLHEGKKECLSCHNAHFGRDARLLASEHHETW